MPSPFVTQHPADFPLQLAIAGLHSAEDVRLDLGVTLTLRIADPARFETQFAATNGPLTEARLAELLAQTAATGLGPFFHRQRLADLDANPNLRSWLSTAIQHALRDEADLAGRSGIEVLGVDAYDLRCEVLDELHAARETLYLRASLAQAEAAGRRLLDEQVLAELAAYVPVKEEEVQRKEEMARLLERENQVDERLRDTRRASRESLHTWIASLRNPPSQLRPELWRRTLGDPPSSAPLFHEGRVFIATRAGDVHAFDAETGEPAWPQPARLGVQPGDGLAAAGGQVWMPGHDGLLYSLDAATGAAKQPIAAGAALTSAPVVAGQRLLLSTDLVGLDMRPGYGQVVVFDPVRRAVVHAWPVSGQAGLRAHPVVEGDTAYVGDRKGGVFTLSLSSGRAEQILALKGKVLGAICLDPRRKRLIVGDSYGLVTSLTPTGRIQWQERVGGPVVGQPLLAEDSLFVAAGDGRLYQFSPESGKPLREPFATGGPIATSPVAWNGLVFAGSNDGYLYAVDAANGQLFWKYSSGSPISLPPALAPDGRLIAVDQHGRLNAVRWCLSRYAEGARRLQARQPPPWDQIFELWLAAGEVEDARQAARQAGRLDLAAELALGLSLYGEAARTYELLARQQLRDATRAARWWAEAARAWLLEGKAAQAEQCRLKDAESRGAPLLQLASADQPRLTVREESDVQVAVRNLTRFLACNVRVSYQGHVRRAGQIDVSSLDAHEEKTVRIPVIPTESGSAVLAVTAHYDDAQGRHQLPVQLEIRLKVNQPPEVHQHFYGPHISGDGVIILRGSASGREVRVQCVEDSVTINR